MSAAPAVGRAPAPGSSEPIVRDLRVRAFRVPTDRPESDGTLAWESTTLVVVEATAGDAVGLGYTYADTATAALVRDVLADVVRGRDAFDTPGAWRAMAVRIRNLGRPGVAGMAISGVDAALWDVKARLLGLPLARLLGLARGSVELYGSGGFTSYSDAELQAQLGGWAADGFHRVKMKVGREASRDPLRVARARDAVGPEVELFVDANGAYDRAEALRLAEVFGDFDVRWFEEPLSSDDAPGLAWLRGRVPGGMAIAAGEYGYRQDDFRILLETQAVDVLQADATRCGGPTGFLRAVALADAFHVPLSTHCAPTLHLPLAAASPSVRHMEWFHDHVRIEHLLFDGAPSPVEGLLAPDLTRPGLGLELRESDAERYRIA